MISDLEIKEKNKTRFRDALIGMFVGLAFMIPISLQNDFFKPLPYGIVEVLTIHRDDKGDIFYKASFYKSRPCEFQRLGVFGKRLGSWEILDWKDNNGQEGDRLTGEHTLTITIQGKPDYTDYEIRTEHKCGDTRVDGTFNRFRYDDIEE